MDIDYDIRVVRTRDCEDAIGTSVQDLTLCREVSGEEFMLVPKGNEVIYHTCENKSSLDKLNSDGNWHSWTPWSYVNPPEPCGLRQHHKLPSSVRNRTCQAKILTGQQICTPVGDTEQETRSNLLYSECIQGFEVCMKLRQHYTNNIVI